MDFGEIDTHNARRFISISTRFGVFTKPLGAKAQLPAVLILNSAHDDPLPTELGIAFAKAGFASLAAAVNTPEKADVTLFAPVNIQPPLNIETAWTGVIAIGAAGRIAAMLAGERRSGGTVLISYMPTDDAIGSEAHNSLMNSSGPILFLSSSGADHESERASAYCQTLQAVGVQATSLEISDPRLQSMNLRQCITFNAVAWLVGAHHSRMKRLVPRNGSH